ncbi:hypothetical protein BYT27DRAFT_7305306 [Phlegmacium glaucopus]|nr:hypothetical protein BYT27DRAFT_7305306 [Phlegmacium glaucopus]
MPEITYGSIHLCMVSEVFEHPFDLTKVCLQSHILDEMVWFNGPIDRLTKTWKIEAPIFGAMVENVSLFLSYGEIQSLIRRISHRAPQEKLPLYHLALAAAGAGAITSFLLTPIELVKCKMQVQMLVALPIGAEVLGGVHQKRPGPISFPTFLSPSPSFFNTCYSPSSSFFQKNIIIKRKATQIKFEIFILIAQYSFLSPIIGS